MIDATLLPVAFAFLVAHLPRFRFRASSPLVRIRQRRAVRRQQARDRAYQAAMKRIEQNEFDCFCAAILSGLRDNELPVAEEAFHATR